MDPETTRTVYMDGVFDLFHIGHLRAIERCATLGHRVLIGVVGDDACAEYKRRPIVREHERADIVRALRVVDEVICPCPLVVSEEFMRAHRIGLVVHGFANQADAASQDHFYAVPRRLNMFREVPYYNGCSTTEIIERICHERG